MKRNVPLLFASGYEDIIILDRYPASVKCDKPFTMSILLKTLTRLIGSARPE